MGLLKINKTAINGGDVAVEKEQNVDVFYIHLGNIDFALEFSRSELEILKDLIEQILRITK